MNEINKTIPQFDDNNFFARFITTHKNINGRWIIPNDCLDIVLSIPEGQTAYKQDDDKIIYIDKEQFVTASECSKYKEKVLCSEWIAKGHSLDDLTPLSPSDDDVWDADLKQWVVDLALLKQTKMKEVINIYSQYTYMFNCFNPDDAKLITSNVLKSICLTAQLSSDLTFEICLENTILVLSKEKAVDLITTGKTMMDNSYQTAKFHLKHKINFFTDVSELQNFDITAPFEWEGENYQLINDYHQIDLSLF